MREFSFFIAECFKVFQSVKECFVEKTDDEKIAISRHPHCNAIQLSLFFTNSSCSSFLFSLPIHSLSVTHSRSFLSVILSQVVCGVGRENIESWGRRKRSTRDIHT